VSLGVVAGSAALAAHIARRRTSRGKQARVPGAAQGGRWTERLWELGVFIVPVGIVAALAVPIIAHAWFPRMDPLSGDSLWLVCAAILAIALVLFASLRGAASLPGRWPRIGFGLLGLAHAAIVLVAPYLMVSHGWAASGLALAAMLVGFAPLARLLYRRAPAWLVTALWLAQGGGAIAALWWSPWGQAPGSASAAVLALVVGAIAVPMQFGFYLLTCSAWNGHNNEAGITARLTVCKQWIRFHVTRDAVTGYVIGIDDPLAPNAAPRLIDRFAIAPAPAADVRRGGER
jgi:hypothetical protein